METSNHFDVIIVGGSYAGLSAAMALGRASRTVLILDTGQPCNSSTPRSHNFLTRDGETPGEILVKAMEQVRRYPTLTFLKEAALDARKKENGFGITTSGQQHFSSSKLIFATGIKDLLPPVPGLEACWGKSVIHCPYCHGYEVKNEPTGLLSSGNIAYEFGKMVHHWTRHLILLTNGEEGSNEEQEGQLLKKGITIRKNRILQVEHSDGYLSGIIMEDGSQLPLKVLYHKPAFRQHCTLPFNLGCAFTEHGHILVDPFQKTTIPGVFACGDNSNPMRSLSTAVASGTLAGAMTNKELVDEEF